MVGVINTTNLILKNGHFCIMYILLKLRRKEKKKEGKKKQSKKETEVKKEDHQPNKKKQAKRLWTQFRFLALGISSP